MRVLTSVADIESVAGGMGSRGNADNGMNCQNIVGGVTTAAIDIGVGVVASAAAVVMAPEASAAAAAAGATITPGVIFGGVATIVSDVSGIAGSLGASFANMVCPDPVSSWANNNADVMATTGLTKDELLSAF